MAVNDIHSVALVQKYEDYRPVNVFHYIETVEGPSGFSNQELANGANTTFISNWAVAVSTALELLCLITKTIHPNPTVPFVLSPLSFSAGLKAGSSMPGQTQAVVRKYPLEGAIPFLVGHFNVSGTIEADWLEGQMEAVLNGHLATLATDMETTIVSGGYTFEPVIWSPTRKKLVTPPFHIGYSSSLVNFGVKVLRRRRGFYHSFA